ncbi:unnamed protein product [Adineta steineri]|uniref:Uncharacterized protein n=1 Tax=Adineta steineri TaxID=433720 RepID=A0A815NMP0_9BILA|nr:unnamed protein product [Adineta steineri]CAF1431753.1 unnamed protein product [Adineta steineri]CAF3752556.1 unnamed protein product [Adineta steineri]CAF3761301.1 unnamed protein product [Adineta steineri]
MLFLSDISSIKDRVEGAGAGCQGCNLTTLLCSVIFCPFVVLGLLCRGCCAKSSAVPITLRGAFGTEVFTLPGNEVRNALAAIPAAAIPHKTSRHSSNPVPIGPPYPVYPPIDPVSYDHKGHKSGKKHHNHNYNDPGNGAF